MPTEEANIKENKKKSSQTIYIGNLNYKITEKDLCGIFRKYSRVGRVHLVTDSKTKKKTGIAFVEVFGESNAQKAIKGLNGKTLDGRVAKVSIAEERATQKSKKRIENRKKQSSKKNKTIYKDQVK